MDELGNEFWPELEPESELGSRLLDFLVEEVQADELRRDEFRRSLPQGTEQIDMFTAAELLALSLQKRLREVREFERTEARGKSTSRSCPRPPTREWQVGLGRPRR